MPLRGIYLLHPNDQEKTTIQLRDAVYSYDYRGRKDVTDRRTHKPWSAIVKEVRELGVPLINRYGQPRSRLHVLAYIRIKRSKSSRQKTLKSLKGYQSDLILPGQRCKLLVSTESRVHQRNNLSHSR